MLENIQAAPPDAILGLTEAFRNDPSPDKVNLTVGVYQDEHGQTPVLKSVRAAEARMLERGGVSGYLPISGLAEFCELTQSLFFGSDHEALTSGRAATFQTPGGTGALRVAADFIHWNLPSASIWCSTPTWPNHPKVFAAAGLDVHEYPYFDGKSHGVNVEAMLESIAGIPAGDVICLHACCHNPTGADPSPDEWKQIADAVDAKGLLPLLDFAYLGFGDGIEADRTALLEFARPGAELLVAASYSKNFGLYRERTGALTVVTPTLEMSGTVASRVKTAIRTNYSNPPAHGATVVREILRDDELRKQWDSELAGMRDRINAMRTLFTRSMAERLPDRDFSFIGQQRGMFSYSGLTGEQVDQLRERYSIYVVRDGRINVAGLNTENVPTVCDAIASVLSEASG